MTKILQICLLYLTLLRKSFSNEIIWDTDDFQILRLHHELFIDKSRFIHDFLEAKQSSLLIVRPSGWSKSTNMDMLRRFFRPEIDSKGDIVIKEESNNGKLFLGGSIQLQSNLSKQLNRLKIADVADATKHIGKHPVIFVKMKNTFGNSYEEIIGQIINRIKDAFEEHRYLLNSQRITTDDELRKYFTALAKSEVADFQNSLYFLSGKLNQHFKQTVIILVDDYDAPIINAYLKFGARSQEFNRILELMKNLYRTALTSNVNLFKGALFGSLKISLANDSSSMLDVSTLAHPIFSDFFGFKHSEISELLTQVPSADFFDLKNMKLWYGGYSFPSEGMFYYNSRSIIGYLKSNGTLQYYGPDSNRSTGLVDKLLSSDNIQPKIHQLLSNQGLEFIEFDYAKPIRWDKIPILEVLYLNGYLSSKEISFEKNQKRFIIPNKEMNFFYATKVLQWVIGKFAIDQVQFYSLAEALRSSNINGFEKILEAFLIKAASYIGKLDEEGEVFFVGLMVALQRAMVSSHFTLVGESEGDFSTEEQMLLIPKLSHGDTAIAINYKRVMKTLGFMAQASIEEIRGSQYEEKLRISSRSHVKKMLKLGIAFCRDMVLVKHEIGDL